MSDDEVNWRRYLAEFHTERAGVVEDVLSRSRGGDHSPYRWLARAVSADANLVLDLACGSGAMSRELVRPGRTDRSVSTSAPMSSRWPNSAGLGRGSAVTGSRCRSPTAAWMR